MKISKCLDRSLVLAVLLPLMPMVSIALEESSVALHQETIDQYKDHESPNEDGTMKPVAVKRSEIKLLGICIRTDNEQEADKMKGKIFPCIQRYFHGALFEKIPNRTNPGTTFCAYTDYESDLNGAYTYFVGEEVSSFDSPLPEGFRALTIPPQTYAKFTTKPAPMPDVIINAWKNIWATSPEDLGGERSYLADFEIYDERAADHQNIVLDVYIGVKP